MPIDTHAPFRLLSSGLLEVRLTCARAQHSLITLSLQLHLVRFAFLRLSACSVPQTLRIYYL